MFCHCEEGVSPTRQSSKFTVLTGLLRRLPCKLLAMTRRLSCVFTNPIYYLLTTIY
ncbi:MAG: hypothetical protein LBK53_03585 [Heliobacteriaceae bacterium]|nr:hypothetical protein [Heliobacteriaceae bacterium]